MEAPSSRNLVKKLLRGLHFPPWLGIAAAVVGLGGGLAGCGDPLDEEAGHPVACALERSFDGLQAEGCSAPWRPENGQAGRVGWSEGCDVLLAADTVGDRASVQVPSASTPPAPSLRFQLDLSTIGDAEVEVGLGADGRRIELTIRVDGAEANVRQGAGGATRRLPDPAVAEVRIDWTAREVRWSVGAAAAADRMDDLPEGRGGVLLGLVAGNSPVCAAFRDVLLAPSPQPDQKVRK